ncbi:MAG: hypothetical protein MUO76_08050 [Anaerolineaceae bacterium]|nr:hypothetical protein [Anaerolineaceae bacterium]
MDEQFLRGATIFFSRRYCLDQNLGIMAVEIGSGGCGRRPKCVHKGNHKFLQAIKKYSPGVE